MLVFHFVVDRAKGYYVMIGCYVLRVLRKDRMLCNEKCNVVIECDVMRVLRNDLGRIWRRTRS